MKNSGLVYKIPCLDCAGVYVGETMQYLQKRVDAHKYDVRHPEKDSTALAEHSKNLSHRINFDKVSVLGKENNNIRRKIREVIEIMKEKNAVNYKTDSMEIFTFYAHLLRDS